MDDGFEKEVETMCNLSLGVKEEGIAIGEERGIAIGKERGIAIGERNLIKTMFQNGMLVEKIAAAINRDASEIKKILNVK